MGVKLHRFLLVTEHDLEYKSHANWLEENSTQLIFSDDDL